MQKYGKYLCSLVDYHLSEVRQISRESRTQCHQNTHTQNTNTQQHANRLLAPYMHVSVCVLKDTCTYDVRVVSLAKLDPSLHVNKQYLRSFSLV